MIKLYSYVMTEDTGFAPNPYHGVLTLACCKPQIRLCANVGDWVMGTAGKVLTRNAHKQLGWSAEDVGRLVYLMKITGKLTRSEYWENFDEKEYRKGEWPGEVGDNIYELVGKDYKGPTEGARHKPGDKVVDLGPKERGYPHSEVLTSNEFYYFGKEAPKLPPELGLIFVHKNRLHKVIADQGKINELLAYLKNQYGLPSNKPIGEPVNKPKRLDEELVSKTAS